MGSTRRSLRGRLAALTRLFVPRTDGDWTDGDWTDGDWTGGDWTDDGRVTCAWIDEVGFVAIVDEALAGLPPAFADRLDNVVVTVADVDPADPGLLGAYEGVALTDASDAGFGYDLTAPMPGVITIYRLALLAMCADHDELVEEVHVTVLHEVAHHFGIDDDRLDELGWA